MKFLTPIILVCLVLAGSAHAQSPVAKGGPQAKLTVTPKRVDAGETFTLSARGFSPNASVIVWFAITGQDPYGSYSPLYPTTAAGTFSIPFTFEQCGSGSTDLTLTLMDSFGVSASARLTLC